MAVDCNETQWRSTEGGESTDTTKEKFSLQRNVRSSTFFFLETQKAFNLKRTQVTESTEDTSDRVYTGYK